MMEPCAICEQPIESDRGEIHEKGLETIRVISEELGDGVADRLINIPLPIAIHRACRKQYTKPSTVRSKRKRQEGSQDCGESSKSIRRSQTPTFDISANCLYCGGELIDEVRHPDRRNVHEAETLQLIHSVREKCLQRNDDWGMAVQVRVENCGDFVAAEGKYHHDCQVRFHTNKMQEGRVKGRPLGCYDYKKHSAFRKLCQFLDHNDEYQYSIGDLENKMSDFLDGCEGYTSKHLKQKLQDHYRDEMIITKDKGKETIYTFLDTGNRILRANYNNMGLSKRDIIDTAATLIEDEIRLMTFDGSKYPNFSELTDSDSVPPLLLQLLSGIIKSKSKVQYIAKRRRLAISHSIIQAVRPRSFISPILLAIAVYVNTKLESRELVDILSSLSFSDDYRELMRLQDSLIPTTQDSFQLVGDLTNFIFDNADVNMRTLTGRDTWHALGGLACTPDSHENRNFQPDIPRDTTPRSALEHGQFSQIPIKTYKKKSGTGWKSCFARPIKEPTPSSLILFTKLDILWLSSFCLLRSLGAKCYNWSGFMQSVVTGSVGAKSQITILPFINFDPSKPETLYSALCFVQSLVENRAKDYLESTPVKLHATVTVDQPLYAKADDIVEASSELDRIRIIVRLGGFHLAMSYMGAIGFIMKGSGIEDLWGAVYAPNSIEHMLSGHATDHSQKGNPKPPIYSMKMISRKSLML